MQISFFFIFYRLATMFFEPLRFGLLYSIVSSRQDDDIKKSLRFDEIASRQFRLTC